MALHVPTAEVHAAYLRDGITRYSYEEVLAAVAAAERAEADFDAVCAEAVAMLAPYRINCIGETWYGYPEAMQGLVDALGTVDVPGCYSLRLARGSSEALPLGKLNKDAATYRRATRQLRKAMDKATAK